MVTYVEAAAAPLKNTGVIRLYGPMLSRACGAPAS